ncbi:MAG: haloacid dehalogenase type II [Actinomycetota bacterium]|nr:MAG: haloacid dehalogenase type II [Actinomycetota bacterium]
MPTVQPKRPLAVAFDVNETLFNLETLRDNFTGLGLPVRAMEWWFAVILRDGFALASTGDYAQFSTLVESALEEVLMASGMDTNAGATEAMLAEFSKLKPHPDVAESFALLAQAEIPMFTLTNGSAALTEKLLGQAKLQDFIKRRLSVDAVALWKPRPEPYHYAADQAGVPPEALALIAVHPWDIHGAAKAGLVTGWINRGGRSYPRSFEPPSLQSSSLTNLIEQLIGLPVR